MKLLSLLGVLAGLSLTTQAALAGACDGTWVLDLNNGAGAAYTMTVNDPEDDGSFQGSFNNDSSVSGYCQMDWRSGYGTVRFVRSFSGGSQSFNGNVQYDHSGRMTMSGTWTHQNSGSAPTAPLSFYGTSNSSRRPTYYSCEGVYQVQAHQTPGTLVINDYNGQISGNIFGNPISGTCSRGQIQFTRTFQGGYQTYYGSVSYNRRTGRMQMNGTFDHISSDRRSDAYNLTWWAN